MYERGLKYPLARSAKALKPHLICIEWLALPHPFLSQVVVPGSGPGYKLSFSGLVQVWPVRLAVEGSGQKGSPASLFCCRLLRAPMCTSLIN